MNENVKNTFATIIFFGLFVNLMLFFPRPSYLDFNGVWINDEIGEIHCQDGYISLNNTTFKIHKHSQDTVQLSSSCSRKDYYFTYKLNGDKFTLNPIDSLCFSVPIYRDENSKAKPMKFKKSSKQPKFDIPDFFLIYDLPEVEPNWRIFGKWIVTGKTIGEKHWEFVKHADSESEACPKQAKDNLIIIKDEFSEPTQQKNHSYFKAIRNERIFLIHPSSQTSSKNGSFIPGCEIIPYKIVWQSYNQFQLRSPSKEYGDLYNLTFTRKYDSN